ncbi:MAG: diaminopimelate epimerase [Acidobacteria bacterium SCN 69-37]|nr:MAG: diaminopimelate epimerase [Acidobacteria bacterium SCN 69-37]
MASPRSVPLVKAHAFGNDFLLADAAAVADMADPADLARRVCERHRGIGGDGLMLITPTADGADTRLWNADGSRAEISGNGVRCAAAWVAHQRATAVGETLVIGTVAGPRRLTLLAHAEGRLTFRAEMGPPAALREETIAIDEVPVRCVVLRVGNPQCVVLGPVTPERLHAVAAKLAVHPFFPEGTNVELAAVEAPDRVRILIWERGVGPTEASGTGACASAVAAAFAGGAGRAVDVIAPGGTQHVEWTDETIWLTGWAEIVGTAEQWIRA